MQETRTSLGQTYGHYQILREAGRGGMSLVYEARDNRIGRRVALKALSVPLSLTPEMRAAMIARLKREARAIARLSHPNIVTIYDIGEEAGQHYLVMEFLEGVTLRDRLVQGPVSPREASAILDQVAGGLEAVHAAGIVHRDIKPSNVMLLPGGQVKLMDFGVARQQEDTLVTQAGSLVGSPVYMAPEQINGEAGAVSSDLWSLGIVLYEMLVGHPPFTGSNIPNVLYQVTHRAPLPLPQPMPAMQRVIDKALDKNPVRRYRSARELADAFRAALPPKPLASPKPAPRRGAAPRPPRPAAVWAVGLLLLGGLAALPRFLPRHRPAVPEVWTRNHPAPAPAVPVAKAAPLPRPAPKFLPVVRVADSLQERIVRPLRRLPPAHSLPMPPVREAAFIPQSPAPSASPTETGAGPNLLGAWHGRHSHNPAILVITRRQGNTFTGTLSVRTHEADVRVAVNGQVSPQTGVLSMRETRVLWASRPHAWDLGSESGHVVSGGRMEGAGTDIKGRHGLWSFSR